jgi:signal recognition particle subunit SRP54
MDLGRGLRSALAKITGAAIVDEKAVKEMVKELQRTLISNDVNVKLVFELSKRIEQKALDTKMLKGIGVREHIVKVVYDELAGMLGEKYEPKLARHKILLLGLFGSGKTTAAGKLARFYKSKGLSVLLICADVDRPAAYEQLEQVCEKAGARFFGIKGERDAAKIVREGLKVAKEDIIIVDSAGRSAFDEQLVKQLKEISSALGAEEKFLVISADIGQVAGKQAAEFHEAVGLTGVIVTKLDGSGKGGGALSAVASSNAKVAFISTGEKIEDFAIFDAQKFVGRLLGFPDIEALLEKVKTVSEEASLPQDIPEKFTIKVFYEQLKAAKKMGPLGGIFSMLGAADVPQDVVRQSEKKMAQYEAIINSMTKEEREDAPLLRKSKNRLERIAKGAGCKQEDVKEFLSQFEKMDGMMNQFKKNRGFRKRIEKMMGGKDIDLSKLT